jgi:hypothetical protein
MDKETKHLIKWQFIWLDRFLRTTYHIFYRPAYRKFKGKQKYRKTSCFEPLDCSNHDLFH